jgi:voltage-gated potassium channel Kch
VGRSDEGKNNWIYRYKYQDAPNSEIYISSLYFIVTTLVTVGYGDITAINSYEKVMCIILMILGVVSFSIMTGALSSIIASYDSREALLKEKIATLNQLSNDYKIGIDLFNQLAKTIRYDHSKKQKDVL